MSDDPGVRVNHITRHMIGLFNGMAGARRFRQIISNESVKPNATSRVLRDAFSVINSANSDLIDPSAAA